MPDYIIAYRGGNKPASQEEGEANMQRRQAWLADMGEKVVNPGFPLANTRIVSSSSVSADGGADAMSGFTIVSADDQDEALKMAKACPFLDTGGTLEISEMMKLPGK